MGQLAGRSIWQASAGFLITGVGLPLLGVAALGISREEGPAAAQQPGGPGYGLFFTCVLYLTIGPFFAIPRCATVSFTVGIQRLIPAERQPLVLAAFSLAFFAAVLFFSLRPGQILTWIGKLLNPLFLCFLAVLVLRALAAPMRDAAAVEPAGNYAAAPFATGLLEGYNTMDALAGLAFGIIVVQAIRRLGVEEPGQVARNTVLAGLLSSLPEAARGALPPAAADRRRGAVAAAVRPGLRLGLPGAGRAGRRPGGAPPAPPQLKAGPRQRLAGAAGGFCMLANRDAGPGDGDDDDDGTGGRTLFTSRYRTRR